MTDQDIDQVIEVLRRELAQLDDPPAEHRARLDALADALARRRAGAVRGLANTARRADAADEAEPSSGPVLEMVRFYESSHPRMTLLLNDLATRLASMGI